MIGLLSVLVIALIHSSAGRLKFAASRSIILSASCEFIDADPLVGLVGAADVAGAANDGRDSSFCIDAGFGAEAHGSGRIAA